MKLKEGLEAYRGHLGRTAQTSVLISSESGPVFPASIYTCVNVSENPELCEAFFEGTLNHVPCPFGDRVYRLAAPVLYHNEALRLFALVLPDSLRHEEFKRRSELLQELAKERELLPEYVRNFHSVYDTAQLLLLEEQLAAGGGVANGAEAEDATNVVEAPLASNASSSASAALDDQLQAQRTELEAQQRQVEDEQRALAHERERLAAEHLQIEEVANRMERESTRIDEVTAKLATDRAYLDALQAEVEEMRAALQEERATLDEERQEIEVARLNLEQKELRLEQEGPDQGGPVEATQVVTDDQFIEVMGGDASAEVEVLEVSDDDFAEADFADDDFADQETHITDGLSSNAAANRPEPSHAEILEIKSRQLPLRFDEFNASSLNDAVDSSDGLALFAWSLPQARIDALLGGELQFLIQYHEVQDVPLVAVVLASLSDDGLAIDSVARALNLADSNDEALLKRLESDLHARLALYFEADGALAGAWEAGFPLRENIARIRERVEDRLSDPDAELGNFKEAAEAFQAPGFERLGTMRHNFHAQSYNAPQTPQQAKLAAGIVGFWSAPKQLAYLFENRSFPIQDFRAIQQRVASHAVEWGIVLPPPLLKVALEMGMAADASELTERLIANFAEVSVGIRENDLDPVQQWDNWDALIELAQQHGVTPDSDVIELAEVSLKRAQDYQEVGEQEHDMIAAADVSDFEVVLDDDDDVIIDVDQLVVARRSESTGVTYFLPDSALIDSFDDLASMPREDLELLLDDANGRLEAAQMLVERFDSTATSLALDASETMSAPEVAALARFFESRADGLEAELVRCLESCGPSATYIAARALVSIRSASAIPVLLAALRDPKRQGDKQVLARTLANYDDKLLPALTRTIKRDGHDEPVLLLLTYLEQSREGILNDLSRDRSSRLREAAARARDILEAGPG